MAGKVKLTKGDKEALAFALLIAAILLGGTATIALQEHWRNSSCSELGGIVVNLQCGRFEPIEGWKP